MRAFWLWLCLLVVQAAGAQPLAEPLLLGEQVRSIALAGQATYWVEPGRMATAEEVERRAATLPFAVRRPGAQHRLDGQALWLRFDAEVRGPQAWYLAVGASGVDRVQMFHRAADGSWVAQEAGDSRPVSQWPVPGRVPTFELARPTGQPVTYWVRIEHELVDFGADLALYSQAALLEVREREQFLLGAYFGVAALLALVALAHAVGYRDRNFAVYGVYLVLFTLGQAAYLGLGAQHLWDPWLGWDKTSTFLLPGL